MSVTGYLALYTTLIGWQQYQNLWHLMVGTGLVFIPFIGLVLKNFLEPFESQEPKSAAVTTLRRLMIQTVGTLLIIEFCCVPTIPLNPKVLHFEPACVSNAKVATPGHTGTTYDNQFLVPTGVKVPLIWYLVMAVSNGFTHAATEGIHCQKINYRELQSTLDVTRIVDPMVKKETIAFYNDCYVPAYSQYMSGDLSDSQKAQIKQYQRQYGQDDLGWIGSYVFLHTHGFYDLLFAHKPIAGFLFDAKRDQFEGQVRPHSRWGQPSCQTWWTDSQDGLEAKLKKSLPTGFFTKELAIIGIRHLIKHSFDPGMTFGEISRGYESLQDERQGNWISESIGASIGIGLEQMSYYPKLALLINALPVIQALLLMSIYALLALIIPFSSYRLHFIITGAAIIFAITFWSYLWHVVLHLDNSLIPALYPQGSGLLAMKQWLHNNGGFNVTFVDFIIGTLYVALPLLFLILMSWAGLKVSSGIMGALSGAEVIASSAGRQAGGMAKQALTMGITTAARKLPKS